MTQKHFIKFLCLFWGICSMASAQEKPINIIESLKQIQKKPEEGKDDRLNVLLKQVRSGQEQQSLEGLGLSDKAAERYRLLKDPFVPQLPVQEIVAPPPPAPPEVITAPEPERVAPPPPPEKPNFQLHGLIWNSDKPQAIVNGQIVAIGDTVETWKVTGISKDGIEVRKEDQTFVIERTDMLRNAGPSNSRTNEPTSVNRENLFRELEKTAESNSRQQTQSRKTNRSNGRTSASRIPKEYR